LLAGAAVDSLLLVVRVLAKLAFKIRRKRNLYKVEIFQIECFKKRLPLNVNSLIVFNIFNKSIRVEIN